MATGTGSATIDFGAYPGSCEASVVVTGQAFITAGLSKCEAYFASDDTSSDHTAIDHRWAPAFISLTAGEVVTATSLTIRAVSQQQMQGTWTVRYVWAD